MPQVSSISPPDAKQIDPMVASSNRYQDVEPYCSIVYHHEPQKWGGIVPWQFPQAASRQVEEAFLRLWFEEREIHIQGGAHGRGDGFRFLKQVWYNIAIYNANIRIPAIAQWWWDKESNREIVEDKLMLDHICDPEAKPEAFFNAEELKMYGSDLLIWVVRHIQAMAKMKASPQPGLPTIKKRSPLHEQTAVESSGQQIPIASEQPSARIKTAQTNLLQTQNVVAQQDVTTSGRGNVSSGRSTAVSASDTAAVHSFGRKFDLKSTGNAAKPLFNGSRATDTSSSSGAASMRSLPVSQRTDYVRSGSISFRMPVRGPPAHPMSPEAIFWQSPSHPAPMPPLSAYANPATAIQPDFPSFAPEQLASGPHIQPQHGHVRHAPPFDNMPHNFDNSRGRGNGSLRGKPRVRGKGYRRDSSTVSANPTDDSFFSRGADHRGKPFSYLPLRQPSDPYGNINPVNHSPGHGMPMNAAFVGQMHPQHSPHAAQHVQIPQTTKLHDQAHTTPGCDAASQVPVSLNDLANHEQKQEEEDPTANHVARDFIGTKRFDVTQIVMFNAPLGTTANEIERLLATINVPGAKVHVSEKFNRPIIFATCRSHDDARRALLLDKTLYRDTLLTVEVSKRFWDPNWTVSQAYDRSKPDMHMPYGQVDHHDRSWAVLDNHDSMSWHPTANVQTTVPQRVMSQHITSTGRIPPPQDARLHEGLLNYETVIDNTRRSASGSVLPAPKKGKSKKTRVDRKRATVAAVAAASAVAENADTEDDPSQPISSEDKPSSDPSRTAVATTTAVENVKPSNSALHTADKLSPAIAPSDEQTAEHVAPKSVVSSEEPPVSYEEVRGEVNTGPTPSSPPQVVSQGAGTDTSKPEQSATAKTESPETSQITVPASSEASNTPQQPPKNPVAPKIEKPKGPSQTESFSMFGRRAEKSKKKDIKGKGTIKSKPKEKLKAVRVTSAPSMLDDLSSQTTKESIIGTETSTKAAGKKRAKSTAASTLPPGLNTTRVGAALPENHDPSNTTDAEAQVSPSKRKGGSLSTLFGLLGMPPDNCTVQAHDSQDAALLTRALAANNADHRQTPESEIQTSSKQEAMALDTTASTSHDSANDSPLTASEHSTVMNEPSHTPPAQATLETSPQATTLTSPPQASPPMYVFGDGHVSAHHSRDSDENAISICMLNASGESSPESASRQAADADVADDSSHTLSAWSEGTGAPAQSSPGPRVAEIQSRAQKHLVEAPPPRNAHKRRAYVSSTNKSEDQEPESTLAVVADTWLSELIIRTHDSQGNRVEQHFPNQVSLLLERERNEERDEHNTSGSPGILLVLDALDNARENSVTDGFHQTDERPGLSVNNPLSATTGVDSVDRFEELEDADDNDDDDESD